MRTSFLFTPETPEEQKALLSLIGEVKARTAQPEAPQSKFQLTAPECKVCGEVMIKKTGEKNGKKWVGWFCLKSTIEDNHPPLWL